MRAWTAASAALAVMAAPAQARAQEIFGGLFVHDIDSPLTRSGQEGGIDVHLGWRGHRIVALRAVGAPSPHIFASVNTAGDTSFAGAGISWRIGGGPVYFRPGIGIAVHDGRGRDTVTPDRIDFGSRILFVPEGAVGVRLEDRWSAELALVHLSHAQLFSRQNPGSDNVGIRVNYRFR